MRVEESGLTDLGDYESVSIGFWVEERIDPRTGETKQVDRFWKDYDQLNDACPSNLQYQYSVANWGVLRAFIDDKLVGGAIIAWNSDYEMLEGRTDRAVLVDLRVDGAYRRQAIGSKLFDSAVEWAWAKGCSELIVETQDINVSACRFYQAKECEMVRFDPNGYEELDEAMIIWRLAR